MRLIPAGEIAASLDYPALIDAIADAFRAEITVPQRLNLEIPRPGADATLLLMPAWNDGTESFVGIKVIAIFPTNLSRGIPSLTGGYLLLSGDTGLPLAILDAGELTRWRTAAASALAARFLARADASKLLIVGAGALAPYFARAHAAVRPIDEVSIWNRTAGRAERLAADLRAQGIAAGAIADLQAGVRAADIVTSVTGSTEP
jgi:ornithine cyclodeaminase